MEPSIIRLSSSQWTSLYLGLLTPLRSEKNMCVGWMLSANMDSWPERKPSCYPPQPPSTWCFGQHSSRTPTLLSALFFDNSTTGNILCSQALLPLCGSQRDPYYDVPCTTLHSSHLVRRNTLTTSLSPQPTSDTSEGPTFKLPTLSPGSSSPKLTFPTALWTSYSSVGYSNKILLVMPWLRARVHSSWKRSKSPTLRTTFFVTYPWDIHTHTIRLPSDTMSPWHQVSIQLPNDHRTGLCKSYRWKNYTSFITICKSLWQKKKSRNLQETELPHLM